MVPFSLLKPLLSAIILATGISAQTFELTSPGSAYCVLSLTDVVGCTAFVQINANAVCSASTGTISVAVPDDNNGCGGTATVNFSPPTPSAGFPVDYITADNENSAGCDVPSLPSGDAGESCSA
ncbi:hypothetical protein MMC28_010484 [Mycoblastus sanguinarius]|nr:hypothetical protein [Mycoblastus sanguinarius]